MTRPEYPRLDELIAAHGGYDRITPEAWAEHDRRVERFQADYREGLPAHQKVKP